MTGLLRAEKRTLVLIAGLVWLAAGLNVARLGILAYLGTFSASHVQLSVLIFALFGFLFYRMSKKHIKRILSYEDGKLCVFRFFDWKSYCIMAFMMSGGIWLRSSGLVSEWIIAFFYTGLGLALAVAGISFTVEYMILKHTKESGTRGE